MPQLDTIYIFTVYVWTWLTIHLVTQKIKNMLMTLPPHKHHTTYKPKQPLTWM